LFTVFEFGPLSGWINSYWGGDVTAFAGCLVFGALPRLRERARWRDAVLLGAGLGIHLLTRPYESIYLLLSVILFFLPELRSRMQSLRLLRVAPAVVVAVLPAIAVTLVQNKEVTGRWTTLPYQLSQYQYGVPMALTILPNPKPHVPLTREQRLEYASQLSYHGEGTDTPSKFFIGLGSRVRYYRTFFLAPLYIAFAIFLVTIRSYRYGWVVLTFLLFALGTNLFPYFYARYAGAEVCLFILASVVGLERLSRFRIRGHEAGREAAAVLICLCIAIFAFRYALYAADNADSRPNYRRAIYHRLAKLPGKQLVFVHYSPHHVFQHEWVYNRADIDDAHVVWARDLGPTEDKKLRSYYPHRTCWLLDADAMPPVLTHYPSTPASSPFLEVP
jgi:4-amino-4-deoxy-L-arabinose transferase-like glycosyltransferase